MYKYILVDSRLDSVIVSLNKKQKLSVKRVDDTTVPSPTNRPGD